MISTGKSPFYGWYIVAAGFAIMLVGFGCAYTFSAFVASLQQEFGASRGSVSLVFSLAGFLYFGLGIVSGPLADRYGARIFAILGMVLVAMGLILASRAQTLMQVYIAYGVGIGIGVGFSYVPVVAVIQKWFVRRRAFASGIAVSGIGVGTLVMPSLATLLIDGFDWRTAYLILGVLALVAGVLAALPIVDRPERLGLSPDGEAIDPTRPASTPGPSVRDAIRTRRFASLYAACLLASFGVFTPFVHLVPYADDVHLAPGTGALLLGLIGVGSTAGRFLLGGLADRMGRDLFLAGAYAGMAASLCIWALGTTLVPLAAFALLFGTFYGGWVAMLPPVVADHFGGTNVSGIIGVLYTSVAFGTLLGPTAAGILFDTTGSYLIPITASIAGLVVATIVSVLALKLERAT